MGLESDAHNSAINSHIHKFICSRSVRYKFIKILNNKDNSHYYCLVHSKKNCRRNFMHLRAAFNFLTPIRGLKVPLTSLWSLCFEVSQYFPYEELNQKLNLAHALSSNRLHFDLAKGGTISH